MPSASLRLHFRGLLITEDSRVQAPRIIRSNRTSAGGACAAGPVIMKQLPPRWLGGWLALAGQLVCRTLNLVMTPFSTV